jgi:uncharacterized protein YqjF (DUF2071 family)
MDEGTLPHERSPAYTPAQIVADVAHRPWPLPRAPWILAMQWHDLLFMHWPVDPDLLLPRIPPGLTLETFEGMAWIGVVPFYMRGVRARLVPPLPRLSTLAELNVRTYVSRGGKPGVLFFSLDAENPLAVRGARLAYRLPYYDARMSVRWRDGAVHYRSARTHRLAPPAALRCRYWPTGAARHAPAGSLDAWLTERYCLYTADWRGAVWRSDIHHPPWLLEPAEVEIEENSMVDPLRLALPHRRPLLHFARRQDVLAWLPAVADDV